MMMIIIIMTASMMMIIMSASYTVDYDCIEEGLNITIVIIMIASYTYDDYHRNPDDYFVHT